MRNNKFSKIFFALVEVHRRCESGVTRTPALPASACVLGVV